VFCYNAVFRFDVMGLISCSGLPCITHVQVQVQLPAAVSLTHFRLSLEHLLLHSSFISLALREPIIPITPITASIGQFHPRWILLQSSAKPVVFKLALR
jgi:hypothetical protein